MLQILTGNSSVFAMIVLHEGEVQCLSETEGKGDVVETRGGGGGGGSVEATFGERCNFSHYLRSSRWTPGKFSSVPGSTRASSAVFLSLAWVGRGKLARMASRFSTNCPSCFRNFAL